MPEKTIIIGGTGMLAEASRAIATKSTAMILIARSPEKLAKDLKVPSISMDWNDAHSIEKALNALRQEAPADCLISWIHDTGLPCLPDFENFLKKEGRSIRVHGSAAGDPRDGIKTDPAAPKGVFRQNVVLGWVKEEGGQKRWLTNREISSGVIEAFSHPQQSAFIVGQLT